MIKTEYICDKCGKSQTTTGQMWTIGITYKHTAIGSTALRGEYPQKSALWCRECMESMLVLPKYENGEVKEATPPTFEELLRAIINEAVEEAIETKGR